MTDGLSLLSEEIAQLRQENEQFKEDLDRVNYMFAVEDRGWKLLTGSDDSEEGLSLDQLKTLSKDLREKAAVAPLHKRAIDLRYSYAFSKPFSYAGLDLDKPAQGRPSGLRGFYLNAKNQRYLFGDTARREMNSAAATDGTYILIGDDIAKTVSPVKIEWISGLYVNSDNPDEILAYHLTYQREDENGNSTEYDRWVYTDLFTGRRKQSFTRNGKQVAVERNKTIIDVKFNTQSGWTLGIPDIMAGDPYNRAYIEMINHGRVVSEALSRFISKVKVKSKKGSDNVGLKMAQGGQGQIVAYGEGNEVDVFSSAGKTYDFNGIRAVAALYATSVGVSIVHLLSDPGAAGSSYGSASNLDLPTKRSQVARQNEWAAFDQRVLKWATGKDVVVTPPSLDEVDAYREAQVVTLGWNGGAFHPEEYRNRMLRIAGVTPTETTGAPKGILIPNNANSLPRRDIDTDSSGSVPSTAASPDQGQASGTGGQDNVGRDERTDILANMLSTSQLDRFEQLVERMEAASKADQ